LVLPGRLARWHRQRHPGVKFKPLELEAHFRSLLTQILGVPLVALPLLQYVSTYRRDVEAREELARAEFEQRYRESAQLLASPHAATQVLGLHGLGRLVDESAPESARQILRGLAATASTMSPIPERADPMQRASVTATVLVEIIARPRADSGDLALTLRRAFLRGIDAHRVNLNHADLSHSDLSGADLYETRLYQANLRFTDFRGANLSGADLSRARIAARR
jgi:hypothetical protein